MAFQTRNLWMLALGLEDDVPPSMLQPRLPNGMHLRWAFDPVKGFPWCGYYLFRRPSGEKRRADLHQPVLVSAKSRDPRSGSYRRRLW